MESDVSFDIFAKDNFNFTFSSNYDLVKYHKVIEDRRSKRVFFN